VLKGRKRQKVFDFIALPVGQMRTNCYLVYDAKTRECLIIDPGDDADYIVSKISELGLFPQKIVATHGHFDHIMAVNELKLAYKIPFLLNKKDEVLLKWMRKSAVHFIKVDPGPPPIVDQFIEDEEIIGWGLRVIETPGHTPGGICLYSIKEKVLFSGDTLFAEGHVGRSDFAYCNKEDLKRSVKKILGLPKEVKIFPGHGRPTSVGNELFYAKEASDGGKL
jgi:hydroxyacylglutathione hydrolase